MEKKDFGINKLKSTLQESVDTVKDTARKSIDSAKEAAKDIKKTEFDMSAQVAQMKDMFRKKEKASSAEEETLTITCLSTKSAMKIIYYVMAADGVIKKGEQEKLMLIGKELDPEIEKGIDKIIVECQAQLDKAEDPEDYKDVLQDGVEGALLDSLKTEDSFITPKILVWDLLAIAFSDDDYDGTERTLIKYIARRLNIDKAIFLEMESSMMTLMDLEKELAWIKTTDRPYLVIEAMINEIADRMNVIFDSVKDLIAL